MKLIDGLKLKGRPAEIPDCSRDDLPEFFKEMGFKKGAEIGVLKGEFMKKFLDAGLFMYGIDPWKDYSDYQHLEGQQRLDFQFEHTQRLLKPYSNYKIIKKTSMEAIEDFEDESLDFVYIDANHLLKYVIEDICQWSKKVRRGGIIAGHDYIFKRRKEANPIQVKFAVDAYTNAYDIENWYLLGTEKFVEGEKKDRWRSWMWIKDYEEPVPFINS